MWIFCGGMQRSASTLQYQIASTIVEKYNRGQRISWHSIIEHKKVIEKHNIFEGYYVFKSHILTKEIKEQFEKKNAVGIYIYRDIRDVISSLKEKNNTDYTIEQLEIMIKQMIKQHDLWISESSTYVSKYENVICDLKKEVQNIAKHIGIEIDKDFINKTAIELNKDKQKKNILKKINDPAMVTVDQTNKYDPYTLLHVNHILSGDSGRYKKNLSKNQVRIINQLAKNWLKTNGYDI